MPDVLEIGRKQNATEPTLTLLESNDANARLAIAPLSETRIGRRQLAIQPMNGGQIQLTNLSSKVTVEIAGGQRLEPKQIQLLALPITILLPADLTINLTQENTSEPLECLDEGTLAPGQSLAALSTVALNRSGSTSTSDAEQLIQALQVTTDVFQTAHNAAELFDYVTEGALRLAGFDRAQVLLFEQGGWKPVESPTETSQSWRVSQTVLEHVLNQKRTFWHTESNPTAGIDSLANIEAVIAAPILNTDGSVNGVVYCDRTIQQGTSNARAITRLDAQLLTLLACGVASGLARIEQAEAAQLMTSQFEQFFTPELTQELKSNPNLLDGRDADVSILFCDIRGFSRISERIGAQKTFEWINDVMSELSECVIRHRGVLVDYIGDELMAMWGAPQSQDDHANLACRAGLDMLDVLPKLNSRWESVVQEPMDLGIGINSGRVRAGNAGSKRKFKYSPLGNAVNLASRVQGATKYLKTRFLITGQTADLLNDSFLKRELCSVQVVNIEEPVRLFGLGREDKIEAAQLTEEYRQALHEFEAGEFRTAARMLANLLNQFPDDGPSLVLLKRSVQALVDGPNKEHPVWLLGGK